MNFSSVEIELNRMRAESLGENGKKLQALSLMIKSEASGLERRAKILQRLEAELSGNLPSKKRHVYAALRKRLSQKLDEKRLYIKRLHEKQRELYQNVIIQREALGATEHSWINKYYMGEDQ